MARPPVLAAEAVSHWRNGIQIIDLINAQFEAGRVYALVGPNGAGKTTLLRFLGLLEKPGEGRILLNGVDATRQWPDCLALRRQIGFIHQHPVLFRTTVFENVAAGLRFRGQTRSQIRSQVQDILFSFGLSHLARRPAASLSGGEAQKVSLAQVTIFAPEILLLDEPTASLDPRNTFEIEELLNSINQRYGTTIVLVTHDLGQAARLSDELIFMCQGQIVESGPTARVLNNPREARTRLFLSRQLVL
ncbi:MAG: phosphate ABC transporter ATP-binding protein [Deltaproteobacteria bacterium]|nr:phosphate ABC transporter ATP-binding protein [Deltaproteobacteria bacterium]MBW2134003.1 phosphate ABC transporter ATP-binding protein [Deltaproteobacteria bacterium]